MILIHTLLDSTREGFDSCAYEVNDEHIFRFPKVKQAAEQLKVEIDLLPRLQRQANLQIPNFEYIGTQLTNGFPFVGYRKIKGIALQNRLFASLNRPARFELMRRMANFLPGRHPAPRVRAGARI